MAEWSARLTGNPAIATYWIFSRGRPKLKTSAMPSCK